MKMFKSFFTRKNQKNLIDFNEINESIELTQEQILKEQEKFQENAERTRTRIHGGVRPPGKKFRI